jgi:polysaccharide biosynthesis transport protein
VNRSDNEGKHLRPIGASDGALVEYDPNAQAQQDDEVIDIRELLRAVLKRKWVVVSVLAIALVSTTLATMLTLPTYRSFATVEINASGDRILNYQNFTNQEIGRAHV